jgi:hypothetical protein
MLEALPTHISLIVQLAGNPQLFIETGLKFN